MQATNNSGKMGNGKVIDDDLELVQQAKTGNLEAFEKLVDKYEGRIYSLAMRILQNPHDAEDVTQQTFLNVIENLKNFRHESTFSTWIMKIATYAALKIIRKKRGLDTISLDHATDEKKENGEISHPEYIADWKENPSNIVRRNEALRLIEEALAELDESYRIVFLLRDVEGFSIRETADILGISEANVKVRLLRARLQLREKLTRMFGDENKAISNKRH